jgi:hypothetical protein
MKQVQICKGQDIVRSYGITHDLDRQLRARGRRVRRSPNSNQSKRCKYLVHKVQEPIRVHSDGLRRSSWSGRKTLGILVIALDYQGSHILGRRLDGITQRQVATLFDDLGLFADAPERLALSRHQRRRVAWSSNPNRHHHQNKFICHAWQLIRVKETYPHVRVVKISLAEVVAQLESNACTNARAASQPRVLIYR